MLNPKKILAIYKAMDEIRNKFHFENNLFIVVIAIYLLLHMMVIRIIYVEKL